MKIKQKLNMKYIYFLNQLTDERSDGGDQFRIVFFIELILFLKP